MHCTLCECPCYYSLYILAYKPYNTIDQCIHNAGVGGSSPPVATTKTMTYQPPKTQIYWLHCICTAKLCLLYVIYNANPNTFYPHGGVLTAAVLAVVPAQILYKPISKPTSQFPPAHPNLSCIAFAAVG